MYCGCVQTITDDCTTRFGCSRDTMVTKYRFGFGVAWLETRSPGDMAEGRHSVLADVATGSRDISFLPWSLSSPGLIVCKTAQELS